MRRIQAALAVNALPAVPSNNDLLAKNIMDDGRIRLIDYDFSGMNDPMFDVGDLAMEGDYDPDQTRVVCQAYFGAPRPGAVRPGPAVRHRARSTPGRCCSSGWTSCSATRPRRSFDYWQEAIVALGLDQGQARGPVAGSADRRGRRPTGAR